MEQIKKLIEERNEILTLLKNFEKYKERSNHYDKIGMGFNLDNRFCAHEGFTIRVDSWMGTYGNSGCSRELSLDDKIFNHHLLKVLNDNFKELMVSVADSIKAEAEKLKEQALNKIESDKKLIESLND